MYLQQLGNPPQDIEFRKIRDGIFQVTVFSETDKKKLEGKFLMHDFGDQVNKLFSVKIPLVLQEQCKYYNNPKWITIDKLYDSGLRYMTDEQIDNRLKAFGTIIVGCHNDVSKQISGFRTGKKKARIDMTEDMNRWEEWHEVVKIDGKPQKIKGKVNIFLLRTTI